MLIVAHRFLYNSCQVVYTAYHFPARRILIRIIQLVVHLPTNLNTHQLHFAVECDEIIVLDEGRVIIQGDFDTI